MKFSYKHLLPGDFNDNSRVWIYQSSRSFNHSEILQVQNLLDNFVTSWKSHGVPVKGHANILFSQFIVLMADENATGVSGCSIDSSVHVLQQIEQQYEVDLFNWQLLAFIVNDKVEIISRQQINQAVENNFIISQTLFFNNVITTKRELEEKWIIPVSESWLKTKIKQTV
jgi:hypothetical protein